MNNSEIGLCCNFRWKKNDFARINTVGLARYHQPSRKDQIDQFNISDSPRQPALLGCTVGLAALDGAGVEGAVLDVGCHEPADA